MNPNLRLESLAILSSLVLAACGGGNDSPAPAPAPSPAPAGISDAQRVSAATSTVATEPLCSEAALGTYYWEVGDRNGAMASGSVGSGAPTGGTVMWVFSSSKWLYAANVLQKHGVADADVPFLNFTSGYSTFGNAPLCLGGNGVTVAQCLLGRDAQDPNSIGHFDYDSGHMQHHAVNLMNLGVDDNGALAADLIATIGDFGFSYSVPQLAAGVNVAPQGYAQFLRRLLRGELVMAGALGTRKVCAQQAAPGCGATFTPESIGTEAWNYSLGHWVEDDPAVGDHAYSSPGGGGFYPWIDAGKTYYGVVARERNSESGAGYHSAQCGRLIRKAWMTGTVQ